MRDLVAADAVELVAATVEAGASPAEARSWWASYLGQQANTRGVALDELPITPAQLADVIGKVSAGALNTKLARQVVDGVLAGEGEPGRGDRRPRAGGGLRRLRAADRRSTTRWPRSPAVADKIRSGKLQAVGAIVGAVMKATRGQADAAGSGNWCWPPSACEG